MALEISRKRPFKVYVKKLENGFGLKTVNTFTGVENILIITRDSIKKSLHNKKTEEPQSRTLRPLWTQFSEDFLSVTLSIPVMIKSSYAINKMLSQLDQNLRQVNSPIAGIHIFEDTSTIPASNIQKTGLIFVANTDLAREKGVHIKIPGKLINVFFVDGRSNEGKIQFEADSVVKPFTIIVSEYIIYIDICYDFPSKTQMKTIGTQTNKQYLSSSKAQNTKSLMKIESFHLSSSEEAILIQKSTHTKTSTFSVDESQFSQSDLREEEYDEQCMCSTSVFSLNEKQCLERDKIDVDRTEIEGDKTSVKTQKKVLTPVSCLENKCYSEKNEIDVARAKIKQEQPNVKALQISLKSSYSSDSERNKIDVEKLKIEQDQAQVKVIKSPTSLSSLENNCISERYEICISTVEDISDTDPEHLKANSVTERTPSKNSLDSYESHTYSNQTLRCSGNHQDLKPNSLENIKGDENFQTLNAVERNKDKKPFELFDNKSNYTDKITNSSNNIFNSAKQHYSNVLTKNPICKSERSVENSETALKKTTNNKILTEPRLLFESNSNVSIKEIKERLNKTTKSLQQLYSVVEMLEDRIENHVNVTENKKSDHTEEFKNEQFNNTAFAPGDVINLISNESTNTYDSDKTISQEKSIESISNSSIHFPKSLRDLKIMSSDILCELCGSFHSEVGLERSCKQFLDTNREFKENNSCQDMFNQTFLRIENYSRNNESKSTIQSTDSQNTKKHSSCDYLTDNTPRLLDSNDEGSITSHEKHTDYCSQYSEKTCVQKYKSVDILPGNINEEKKNGAIGMERRTENFIDKLIMANKAVSEDYSNKHNVLTAENQFESDNKHVTMEYSGRHKKKSSSLAKSLVSIYRTLIGGNLQREASKISIQSLSSNILEESNESIKDSVCSQNKKSDLKGAVVLSESKAPDVKDIENTSFSILDKKSCLVSAIAADEENISDQNLENTDLFLNQQKRIDTISNNSAFNNTNKTTARENLRVFNFVEFNKTKSCVSFKKSVNNCSLNETLVFKEKTSQSEPNTYQGKMKNLSSRDRLKDNLLQKAPKGPQERLDKSQIVEIRSKFLNNKYSSSSTLHIFPSSEDFLEKRSEKNIQENLIEGKNTTLKFPSKNKNYIKNVQKPKTNKQERNTQFEGITSSSMTKDLNKNKQIKNEKAISRKKRKWFCF